MDIKYYKDLLIREKENLLSADEISGESRKTVTLDQQSVGRLSRMDALQGQAMNNAIQTRRLQAIAKINAALKRIDEGEYGYCVTCGEEIQEKRLKLDPAVARCTDCSQ